MAVGTLLNLIGDGVSDIKTWVLMNVDDPKEPAIKGQFEPQNTTREKRNVWAEHNTLNRSHPILQFVNKESETLSFGAVMYAVDSTYDIAADLAALEEWADPVAKLNNRPPILSFSVGDGSIFMEQCVIESISGITYGALTKLGKLREVRCTVNLRQYHPFSIEETAIYETRYHRTKGGEYYEMLAQREYGNPQLGVVIQQQHPSQAILEAGDVVRLPSIEAVRSDPVELKSIALKTAFGKKDTPQRALRLRVLERYSGSRTSHVLLG
jgi:hypothetical protein